MLDMKMLFLDTVVMPVLSQMIRGRETLVSACCCCLLNTPVFSHQNLHGDTRGHCALAASSGGTSADLSSSLDVRAPPQTPAPRLGGLREPRHYRGFRTSGALLTVRWRGAPSAPHSSCTESWAGAPSRLPALWPGAMSRVAQRTLLSVYNGSTQRGTLFFHFPKGVIRTR